MSSEDSVALHVRTTGDGAPVVLVHGWMVSSRVWDDLARELPFRRLVMPDLRGAGQSARGTAPITLDLLAEDVLRAVEAAGVTSFDLVGHSMGGQLAALVATLAPERVRSLALLNPVPLSGIPLPAEVAGMFRASGRDRAAQGKILEMACRELSEDARTRLLDDAGTIATSTIADAFGAWSTGGDASRYGAVAARTLVLATDDPFLPPDFLREAVVAKLPRARIEVLRGPGHYPQVERAREVAELLVKHWEST